MATGRAQIIREADSQFTLLWFTPNPDGKSMDLVSNQPNLANAAAALDALKPLVAALPGTLYQVVINVATREP